MIEPNAEEPGQLPSDVLSPNQNWSEAETSSCVGAAPTELIGAPLGQQIGPYELGHQIGAGGMGVVYAARQKEPVQRWVALKLVRPGMASPQILARFQHERHVVALMDHPNIATVLDAGLASPGQPYFVMELIHGVPITRYADAARLSIIDRIRLFLQVCDAVQHAHHKGVIHRDLKPSNILVGMYDGRPVPKIIDFGIAKAAGPRLANDDIATEAGQWVGTYEYMAPEQTQIGNPDIDTRSDIYALGVVLYELLAGTVPFARHEFPAGHLTELLRQIQQTDPPKPSTKFSNLAGASAISSCRQTDPHHLRSAIRGDLDWIVLKCLEKDRDRRYSTANMLRVDLQRYLDDQPVLAGPPDWSYRFRKFVKRNRASVLAGSLAAAALFVGLAGTTWGYLRAEQALETSLRSERKALAAAQEQSAARLAEAEERRRAELSEAVAKSERRLAESVRDFWENRILLQANPWVRSDDGPRYSGHNPTMKEILVRAAEEFLPEKLEGRFADQPHVQAELLQSIGIAFHGVGDYERASQHLSRAVAQLSRLHGDDHDLTLDAQIWWATAERKASRPDQSAKLFEDVLRVRTDTDGPEHPRSLAVQSELAVSRWSQGKKQEARKMLEEVRRLQSARLPDNHPDVTMNLDRLALVYVDLGNHRDAIAILEHVRDTKIEQAGPDHPALLGTLSLLATSYSRAGRGADATPLFEWIVKEETRRFGPEHPSTLANLNNLARSLKEAGRFDEAIAIYEQVRQAQSKTLSPDHAHVIANLNNLAVAYRHVGRVKEAAVMLQQVRDNLKPRLGPSHSFVLAAQTNLAKCWLADGRPGDAEPALREVLEIRETKEPNSTLVLELRSLIGESLLGQKKIAEAEPLLLESYQSMLAKKDTLSADGRAKFLAEAAGRIAQLYDHKRQPEQAETWRTEATRWKPAKP